MKDRTITIGSLILSLAAFGYAAWIHYRAEAFVDEPLRRRETELVRAWAPKYDQIYREIFPDLQTRPKTPTTLLELLDPLARMVGHLGEAGEPTNSPAMEVKK
jgi:hypothetical protein